MSNTHTSRRPIRPAVRRGLWAGAALLAVGIVATPAAAFIDDITVTVNPNPAEQSAAVVLDGFCEYSTGETFLSADAFIDGAPVTLNASGAPVDVGGGLTRQNLTGTATAPATPGTYTVAAGCETDGGLAADGQTDLVVTASTTTTSTSVPASTSTTVPVTTTPGTPTTPPNPAPAATPVTPSTPTALAG